MKVDQVTSGVETGHGPGTLAGREFAVFPVTMHNGTTERIDAQQVVVTSTYGTRTLVAERVYAADALAADFGGQVAPGASTTARYGVRDPRQAAGRRAPGRRLRRHSQLRRVRRRRAAGCVNSRCR